MPRVDSSAVERVDYTAESETLDIWYKGGAQYSYFGLPEAVYRALLAAPSIGAFVNLRIKGKYPFEEKASRRCFRPRDG